MGEPRFHTVWYDQSREYSFPEYLNRDELDAYCAHVRELREMMVLPSLEGFSWDEETSDALLKRASHWRTAFWIYKHRSLALRIWCTRIGPTRWKE